MKRPDRSLYSDVVGIGAYRLHSYPVSANLIHFRYKLGPNGAILTSLNLFATKFDQVLQLLEKRANQFDIILIDTPGQIEAFNWSASGTIILGQLRSTYSIL